MRLKDVRAIIGMCLVFFFFQAEDGIRDLTVTGVQTCALPISKQAIVGDALRRIAKLDIGDPEIVEAVEEWRYSAKVSLAVKGGRGLPRAVGFHPYDRPGSVFHLKDCHIADFKLMALWREP